MRTTEDYRATVEAIRREAGKARLMAVSKTRTVEEIDRVFRCGVDLFGENRVQEIVAKFSSYKPAGLELHLIGHLQSNKVASVVPLVDMIESIDSYRILEKVDAVACRTGKKMPVLLEVNTSGEEAKSGFRDREELFSCIRKARGLENIVLKGLMTVGPLVHPEKTASAFEELARLKEECRSEFGSFLNEFSLLSMGMSHDWRIAVEKGADIIRIGTAIFGERNA